VSREHEDRTPAATHVQDVLVATKIEVIEKLRPERPLPRPGRIQVAGDDYRRRHAGDTKQRGRLSLAVSFGPQDGTEQSHLHDREQRNDDVASVDAIAASGPGGMRGVVGHVHD
jgi:hypothetical protein